MIKFLKNLRFELTDEKEKIELEQNKIQTELNRNNKFLTSLQAEEDQIYDIFSPRRKNVKLRENIETLKKEQASLLEKEKKLKEKLLQLNLKIGEIDQILKQDREQNLVPAVREKSKREQNMHEVENYLFLEDDAAFQRLLKKIDFCIQILIMDPNRCKLELVALKKMVLEIQKNIFEKGDGADGSSSSIDGR